MPKTECDSKMVADDKSLPGLHINEDVPQVSAEGLTKRENERMIRLSKSYESLKKERAAEKLVMNDHSELLSIIEDLNKGKHVKMMCTRNWVTHKWCYTQLGCKPNWCNT